MSGNWQEDYTKGLYNPGADSSNPATLQGQIDSGVYGKRGGGSGGGGSSGGGAPAPNLMIVLAVLVLGPLAIMVFNIPLAPLLRNPAIWPLIFPPILEGAVFFVIVGALVGAFPVSAALGKTGFMAAAVKLVDKVQHFDRRTSRIVTRCCKSTHNSINEILGTIVRQY